MGKQQPYDDLSDVAKRIAEDLKSGELNKFLEGLRKTEKPEEKKNGFDPEDIKEKFYTEGDEAEYYRGKEAMEDKNAFKADLAILEQLGEKSWPTVEEYNLYETKLAEIKKKYPGEYEAFKQQEDKNAEVMKDIEEVPASQQGIPPPLPKPESIVPEPKEPIYPTPTGEKPAETPFVGPAQPRIHDTTAVSESTAPPASSIKPIEVEQPDNVYDLIRKGTSEKTDVINRTALFYSPFKDDKGKILTPADLNELSPSELAQSGKYLQTYKNELDYLYDFANKTFVSTGDPEIDKNKKIINFLDILGKAQDKSFVDYDARINSLNKFGQELEQKSQTINRNDPKEVSTYLAGIDQYENERKSLLAEYPFLELPESIRNKVPLLNALSTSKFGEQLRIGNPEEETAKSTEYLYERPSGQFGVLTQPSNMSIAEHDKNVLAEALTRIKQAEKKSPLGRDVSNAYEIVRRGMFGAFQQMMPMNVDELSPDKLDVKVRNSLSERIENEFVASTQPQSIYGEIAQGLVTTLTLMPMFAATFKIGGVAQAVNWAGKIRGAAIGGAKLWGGQGAARGIQNLVKDIKELNKKNPDANIIDYAYLTFRDVGGETAKAIMEPLSEVLLPEVKAGKTILNTILKKMSFGVAVETGTEQFSDITGDLVDGTNTSVLMSMLNKGTITPEALKQLIVEASIGAILGASIGAPDIYRSYLEKKYNPENYKTANEFIDKNKSILFGNIKKMLQAQTLDEETLNQIAVQLTKPAEGTPTTLVQTGVGEYGEPIQRQLTTEKPAEQPKKEMAGPEVIKKGIPTGEQVTQQIKDLSDDRIAYKEIRSEIDRFLKRDDVIDEKEIAGLADKFKTKEFKDKAGGIYQDILAHNKALNEKNKLTPESLAKKQYGKELKDLGKRAQQLVLFKYNELIKEGKTTLGDIKTVTPKFLKEIQDARKVSEDKGELPPQGVQPEEGQRDSGPNIQQTEEALGPEPAPQVPDETANEPIEEPPPIPPTIQPPPEEPPPAGTPPTIQIPPEDKEEKPSEKFEVKDIDVNEIDTDTELFQNRLEPFSQKTYDNIVNTVKEGKWNWSKFDAIKVWRNPETGKLYTLNHSRLKAFQDLAKEGYKEFQTIPTVEFKGSLEDAIKFAKEESNVMGSQESDIERANIYRGDRKKGISKKEIAEKAKKLEGKNANYIINLSHLNPEGQTIDALKAFEKSGSKQDVKNLETLADWVGEARKRYDDLTDTHEDEIFKWLKDGAYEKIGNRTKFLDRIDNTVSNITFDKNKPLGLDVKPTKGYNQTQVESQIKEVRDKIKALESERDNKKVPPTEKRLNEITEEIKLLNKDLGKLNEDLRKAKEADQAQGGLFEGDEEKPAQVGISVEEFEKLKVGDEVYIINHDKDKREKQKIVKVEKGSIFLQPAGVWRTTSALDRHPVFREDSKVEKPPKKQIKSFEELREYWERREAAIAERMNADAIARFANEWVAPLKATHKKFNDLLRKAINEKNIAKYYDELNNLDAEFSDLYSAADKAVGTINPNVRKIIDDIAKKIKEGQEKKPAEKKAKKEVEKPKGQFEGDKPDMPRSEDDFKKALDKIKNKKKPPENPPESFTSKARTIKDSMEAMADFGGFRNLSKEEVQNYVDVGVYIYQDKQFRKKHLWANQLLKVIENDINLDSDFIDYIWKEIQVKYADQITVTEDFNTGNLEEYDTVDKKPEAVIIDEKNIPKPKDNFKTEDYEGILSEGQILGINLALDRVLNGKAFLLGDGTGFGKCQPLDSKVYTPSGVKKMGDLQIGDEVLTPQNKRAKIIGIYPQGRKNIYRITFSDGATVESCDEHLWATKTRNERRRNKPYKVRQLSEIIDTVHHLSGTDIYSNHSIPITEAVDFNPQKIHLDPYLIGVLIGDACLQKGGATLSSNDSEIIDNIRSILPSGVGINFKQKYEYSITTATKEKRSNGRNPVNQALREYSLTEKRSDTKFIPDEYKYNTKEIRLAVLQGLMDTDGTVDKKGYTPIFYTTSEQLKNDVVFIVQSLGGIAKCSIKETGFKPCHVISISLPNGTNPFRLSRKKNLVREKTKYFPQRLIRKVEYVGEKLAQCIMIDDPNHLYLTDHFVVTHNTMQMLVVANEYHKKTGKPVLILAPDDKILRGFVRDSYKLKVDTSKFTLGTYGRMTNGKYHGVNWGLVLLDEAHKMKNLDSQRTQAFWQLKADNKLFATATPMDKITGATYFFAEITGKTEDEVARELGYKIVFIEVPDPETQKMVPKKTAVLLQGFNWDQVKNNIIKLRDKAIQEGAMVRREYPFWGHIRYFHTSLPDEYFGYQSQVNDYFEKMKAKARSLTAKINYARMRVMNLNKLSEAHKNEILVKKILEDLEAGKSVAVMGEFHGELKVEGIPDKVGIKDNGRPYPYKSFRGVLGQLAEELDKRNIPYAKIFEDKSDIKLAEAKKFVSGEVRVALFTPTSGGTGIDLDDQVGDKPRVVYFPNLNFAADVFEQALGRFNRKNTKSPTEVRIILSTASNIDTRKYNILKDKMRIMRRIQSGEDPDRVTGFSEDYIDLGDVLEGDINDVEPEGKDFVEVRPNKSPENKAQYGIHSRWFFLFDEFTRLYGTELKSEAKWILPNGKYLKGQPPQDVARNSGTAHGLRSGSYRFTNDELLEKGMIRVTQNTAEMKARPTSVSLQKLEEFIVDNHKEKKNFFVDLYSEFRPPFHNVYGIIQVEGIMQIHTDINKYYDMDQLEGLVSNQKSIKDQIKESKELLVFHNLSTDQLIKSKRWGGLVAPSLAITKQKIPFEKYGDITLIGNEDLGNPRNLGGKIYESDAWTATHPRVYHYTSESKIYDLYKEIMEPFNDITESPLFYYLDDIRDGKLSLSEIAKYTYKPDNRDGNVLPYLYLRDKNKAFAVPIKKRDISTTEALSKLFEDFARSEEYALMDYDGKREYFSKHLDTWIRDANKNKLKYDEETIDLLVDLNKDNFIEEGLISYTQTDRLIKDADTIRNNRMDYDEEKMQELMKKNFYAKVSKEQYYNWITERFDGLVWGEYIRKGKKKLEYNIDNILRVMKSQMSPEKNAIFFGLGAAKATSAQKVSSLKQLRKLAGRLVTEEEMEAYQKDQFQRFVDMQNKMQPYYEYPQAAFDNLDDMSKSIAQIAKFKAYNIQSAKNILSRNGYKNVTDEYAQEAIDFAKDMSISPSQYFEGKPLRVVEFNEFKAAVIPKTAPKEVTNLLKNNNIEIATYDPSIENDRQKAIDGFSYLAFSPKITDSLFADGKVTPLAIDLLNKMMDETPLKTYPKAFLNKFIKDNNITWDELNAFVNKKEEVSAKDLSDFIYKAKQKAEDEGLFGNLDVIKENRRIAEKKQRFEEREQGQKNQIAKLKATLRYLKNAYPSEPIQKAIDETQYQINMLENKVNNLFNQPEDLPNLFEKNERSDEEMDRKFGSRENATNTAERIDEDLRSITVKDRQGAPVIIPKRLIPRDWKVNRKIDIIGRKIASYVDLADMFYVVRDPSTETQWFVGFNEKDQVVANVGFTSDASGYVEISQIAVENTIKTLKEKGAVRCVMVHNHPSGDSEPSNGDVQYFREYWGMFNDRKINLDGHVVINGDQFHLIKNVSPHGDVRIYNDKFDKPGEHPNQVWYDKFDKDKIATLTSWEQLAQLFSQIKRGDGEVILVALTGLKVYGYESIPAKMYNDPETFNNLADIIAKSLNADEIIVIGDEKDLITKDLKARGTQAGTVFESQNKATLEPRNISNVLAVAYGDKRVVLVDKYNVKQRTRLARASIPMNPQSVGDLYPDTYTSESPKTTDKKSEKLWGQDEIVGGGNIGYRQYTANVDPNFKQSDLNLSKRLRDISKMFINGLEMIEGWHVRTGAGMVKRFSRKARALFFPSLNIVRIGSMTDFHALTHEVGHKLDINIFKFSANMAFDGTKAGKEIVMADGHKDARVRQRLLDLARQKYGNTYVDSVLERKALRDELYSFLVDEGYPVQAYAPSKLTKEGVAEFIRSYIQSPDIIKQKAPKFYQLFEGRLLRENPELHQLFEVVKKEFRGFEEQDPLQRRYATIARKAEEKFLHKTIRNFREKKFYTNFVDALEPLREIDRQLMAKEPNTLGANRALLEVLSTLGIQGKVNLQINSRVFGREGNRIVWKDNVKPLMKILEGPIREGQLPLYEEYLEARRDIELNERGLTGAANSTYLEAVRDKERLEGMLGEAKLQQFAEDIYEFQRAILEYYYKAGKLSPDVYDKILELNKAYVPYKRFFDEYENIGKDQYDKLSQYLKEKSPSPVKPIRGGEQEIKPIFESILENTYDLMVAADRNYALKAFIENLKTLDPSLVQEIPANRLTKGFTPQGKEVWVWKHDPPKGAIVQVSEDGKKVYYQISTDLYEAIFEPTRALSEEDAKFRLRLSLPTRWLQAGAVVYDPTFSVRNLFRDQLTGWMNSKFGYNPSMILKGVSSIAQDDENYQLFLASGGDQSFLTAYDMMLKQEYLNLKQGRKIGKRSQQYIHNPLLLLQDINRLSELLTRVGAYRNALVKTGDPYLAMQEAREITADYAIKGRSKNWQMYLLLSPFLNPRIQHAKILAQNIKNRPLHVAKLGTYISAFSVFNWVLNNLGDDDREKYQQLPQWKKLAGWNIKIPDFIADTFGIARDSYLPPIPKGSLGVIFGTTIEQFLDYLFKNKPHKVWDIVKSYAQEVSPVTTIEELMPQWGRPVLEQLTNKFYFTGKPIVSEQYSYLPEYMQQNDYTSTVMATVTSLIYKGTGEKINISPMRADAFFRAYLSGGYTYPMLFLDEAAEALKLVEEDPEEKWTAFGVDYKRFPLVKQFVPSQVSDQQTRSAIDFFDKLGELEDINKTVNNLHVLDMNEGTESSVRVMEFLHSDKKKLEDYKWYIENQTEINKFRNYMSVIREEKKNIRKSTDIPEPEVAIDRLNKLTMQLAIDFDAAYQKKEEFNLDKKVYEIIGRNKEWKKSVEDAKEELWKELGIKKKKQGSSDIFRSGTRNENTRESSRESGNR